MESVSYCFNYYSIESRKYDASCFFLLFPDWFGYLGCSVVPHIFSIFNMGQSHRRATTPLDMHFPGLGPLESGTGRLAHLWLMAPDSHFPRC